MPYLQQSLGIDFRDRVLRIAHLGRTLKGIVLIDYFIRKYPPLPPSSGKGEAEGEVDPLCLDLQNYIRARGIKKDQIVIGLPKEKVTLKEILLPKVDERQLHEMLEYEVERHLPFAVQGIAFDYQVLGQEGEALKILLGVVKQDDLQKAVNLLSLEETKPPIVDVTTLGGMSWLISQNDLSDQKIMAIVDIGDSRVELVIMAGKDIKVARSFGRLQNRLEDVYINEETAKFAETAKPVDKPAKPAESIRQIEQAADSRIADSRMKENGGVMGGRDEQIPLRLSWAEEVQEDPEKSRQEADSLILPPLSEPPPQEGMVEDTPALEPGDEFIDESTVSLGRDIIRELEIAMQVFSSSSDEEKKLDELILTGTEAYSSFLPEYIEAQTGLEVKILNPLRGLTTKSIPGKIASSLSVATGLALRGLEDQPIMLNFLAEGKKIKRKVNQLVITASLMVLIVVLSLAWVLGLQYESGLVSAELSKRLKALQPEVEVVKNISQEIEKVDRELSMINNIVDSEVSKMELLKELTTILPADTWLDNFNVSNEKLEIDGYSESPSNLISMLEISPLLENVQFGSSITKMGPGKERFKIKADIERKKDSGNLGKGEALGKDKNQVPVKAERGKKTL